MKIKSIECVFVALVLTFTMSTVFAQENGNRDENNKVVRGPYETNGFGGNWFIGAGGGINLGVDGGYKTIVSPNLDIFVGKWMTPSIGARLGYQGLTMNEWAPQPSVLGPELNIDKNMYKRRQGYAYIHADAMWNISNAFSGYKETRFWDVIPYVHGGIYLSYGANGIKWKGGRELAGGVGIYNTMRISNRVKLALDVRATMFRGEAHGCVGGIAGMTSASLGVVVNLGKTNWKRATVIPAGYSTYNVAQIDDLSATAEKLREANKALEQKNTGLAKSYEELKKENEALQKELEEAKAKTKNVSDITPGAVFFNIGQTSLDERELFHLDFYVKTCIEQDAEKTFRLTGYADKETGSKKRNQYLSEKRVEYVYNLLMTKYNIPAERLIIEAAGCEVNRLNSSVLNRSVVLE